MMRVILAGLVMVLAACTQSVQSKRNAWERDVERFVGEPVSTVFFWKESEIVSAGDNEMEFIYRSETSDCVWAYVVDNDTMVIQSWHYIAGEEDCYWRTERPRTIGRN